MIQFCRTFFKETYFIVIFAMNTCFYIKDFCSDDFYAFYEIEISLLSKLRSMKSLFRKKSKLLFFQIKERFKRCETTIRFVHNIVSLLRLLIDTPICFNISIELIEGNQNP